jgi:hypothetical protein
MPNTPAYSVVENRFVRHDTLESDNSGADVLTAFSGGGQAGALPLPAAVNRVTVVAVAGDSVLLPPVSAGADITVINAAGLSLNVFPSPGDAINAVAANGAFAVGAGKTAAFRAVGVAGAGHWASITTV